MESKHTPGPWKYDEMVALDYYPIYAKGFVLAEVHRINHTTEEQMAANAKLIAAAPELLEALQSVLAYEQRCAAKGDPKIGNGILSQIYRAIEKATK